MGEMIELSVEISDIMSYDIKIPKEINSNVFPEVMKRFKAIYNMLQKEDEKNSQPDESSQKKSQTGRGRPANPVMRLNVEESIELIALYKKSTPQGFSNYLKKKYKISPKRKNLARMIWKIKKRMESLNE